MYKYFIVILIGYLIGCLQWSYFYSKGIKKVDIRKLGGGNAGASNAVKSFGWKVGIAVAFLDIMKAIISILIIRYLFKISFLENSLTNIYLNGTGVILGHNYPFFMNFKGGKGTASTVGMLFGIDYRIGIIGFFIILIVSLVSDYIALGTISLVTFLVLITVYLNYETACIMLAIFIFLQSIYKHIPNLRKIKVNQEIRISETFKGKAKTN